MHLTVDNSDSHDCGCGCGDPTIKTFDLVNGFLVSGNISIPFDISIPFEQIKYSYCTLSQSGTHEIHPSALTIMSFSSINGISMGIPMSDVYKYTQIINVAFDTQNLGYHNSATIDVLTTPEISYVATWDNNGDITWLSPVTWQEISSTAYYNEELGGFSFSDNFQIYVDANGDVSTSICVSGADVMLMLTMSGNINSAIDITIQNFEITGVHSRNQSVVKLNNNTFEFYLSNNYAIKPLISSVLMMPINSDSVIINDSSEPLLFHELSVLS